MVATRAALTAAIVTLICALGAAPALGDPGSNAPGPADPGYTGPGATDPGANDPGVTDPGPADPGSGGPGTTDPGSSTTPPTDSPPQSPASPPGLTDLTPQATPVPPLLHEKPTRRHKHAILATPLHTGHTVPGSVAQLLPSGRAAAPAVAPYGVKLIIWTANRLIGLPYRYGGGHASFADNAYDCSGSVSYALHAADAIAYPEDSTLLESWGGRGQGKWVTVYANHGHAWMIVAGLRLDTSPVDDPQGLDGPRWRPADRPRAGYRVRHPIGL